MNDRRKDLVMTIRLAPETVAKLDRIAEHIEREPEAKVGRARSIRYAIRKCIEQIEQAETAGGE